MTQSESLLFEHKCNYCGFAIPVAKREVKERVVCPHCGRANLIGEGQPGVEEIVKDAGRDVAPEQQ